MGSFNFSQKCRGIVERSCQEGGLGRRELPIEAPLCVLCQRRSACVECCCRCEPPAKLCADGDAFEFVRSGYGLR
ncbi:hypothetical protein [Streptomyces malaysiensis]|uniref:Uncharacterized protein n=1 Tax=Streptomyces malaysiensis TaxID=92644 RepID=A0A7X5XCM5_STRMQ|nr:hypothetical protein [Streptomyces malaysiensis]NIY70774.1 hypothetical protein [Streptomyces malaysiensis]